MAFGQGQSGWPIQYLPRRRRRGSDGASVGGGAIVTAPSSLTVADNASVGTVVGTLAVLGGSGSYTFTLSSNPGGLFSITGNQLKVAASLSAGSDSITISADNGVGDTPSLPTVVVVTHASSSVVPTYELWGF